MTTAIVEIRGVGKTYDDGTGGLVDVDLDVRQGEFLALVGPSGCGKSTLLSLIAGLTRASTGTLQWPGTAANRASARRIGFVFQAPTLMPWARLTTNVRLPLDLAGVPRPMADAAVANVLARVHLTSFADHLPRQLSGGMRQRVALARTLCTEPDVVLLDEPFSALDSQTRIALADEVTEILRREGKTAILVTHDIGEAVSMAERVIVLSRRPGRVKSDHAIRFASADGSRPAPFAARNAPEFNGYFNGLWKELEVHVQG